MTLSLFTSSSVTRWLLVVVGCAVLETAQPTKAAEPVSAPAAVEAAEPEPAAPPPRRGDTLLIPGGSPRTAAETSRPGRSSSWLVVLALTAGGAGWFWWRRRAGAPLVRGSRERQIQIEESRPLGNRQYLVVASVGEKKFLLGITPGSIQMLSPLDRQEEPVRAAV